MAKIIRRDAYKTYQHVFDKTTVMTLFELEEDGYLDEIGGNIAMGKEACVFFGFRENEIVAVKIYKIMTSNFKKMWFYIKGDPRFDYVKPKRRDIIFAWTQKEYRNLMRAWELNIRVPKPIAFKNNVLVMEFIGEKGIPAQTAKKKPPKDPKKWFKTIREYIKKMWKNGFVHGDLSEYNILNWKEQPVLIDFSQGVLKEHPQSKRLLVRDIIKISNWFNRLGLKIDKKEFWRYINS